jgi:hypothetical protein
MAVGAAIFVSLLFAIFAIKVIGRIIRNNEVYPVELAEQAV